MNKLQVNFGDIPLLEKAKPTPLLGADDASLLEGQGEEASRPKTEKQTLCFSLSKDHRRTDAEKMNKQLSELVRDGWRVNSKFFSDHTCYASLERIVHPRDCACGECPKLPKGR